MMWLVMALWPQPAHSVVGAPLYVSRSRPMWLWPFADGFSAVAVAVWPSSPESWLVPLVDPRDADSFRRRPSSGGVSLAWIWLASTRGVFSGAWGSRFCLRLSLSLMCWLL